MDERDESSCNEPTPRVMTLAPLCPVAIGMILGIIVDAGYEPHGFVFPCVFLVAAVLTLTTRARRVAGPMLVLVASGCVGGSLHHYQARTLPQSGFAQFVSDDRQLVELRGTVASTPRLLVTTPWDFSRWLSRGDRTTFLLDVESIKGVDETISTRGLVRVTVAEPVLDLEEDEPVEVYGWLYPLRAATNPGAVDWAAYNRRRGVTAGLSCATRDALKRIDPQWRRGFGPVAWMRQTARHLLIDDPAMPEREQSLLAAMVLGRRSQIDRELNAAFIRAGCVHFLAVSGFHVAIVMTLVWWPCRMFGVSRRRGALMMAFALVSYALLADPRPPIFRATILGLMYLASVLLRLPRSPLNWLSLAAILLLAWNTQQVFDVGFQLTFLSVLGVWYLGTKSLASSVVIASIAIRDVIDRYVFRRPFASEDRRLVDVAIARTATRSASLIRRLGRCRRWVFAPLVVSMGAWLAAAPLVVYHFHRMHPYGPLATLAVLPFVYLIMTLGFLKVGLTAVWPALGAGVAPLLAMVERILIRFLEWIGSLPNASLPVGAMPKWLIVLYYASLLLFVVRFYKRKILVAPEAEQETMATPKLVGLFSTRVNLVLTLVWVASLVGVVSGAAIWRRSIRPPDRMVVTVLSVGAGSATVVELPDGKTILYDAGATSPYDVGRGVVVPFLEHRSITRINRAYVSHPNLDHYSGIPSICRDIDVRSIVVNEYFSERSEASSPSRHFLDLIEANGPTLDVLDPAITRWNIGDIEFELLWPPSGLDDTVSANNTSSVLRITYQGRSLLLTGDIEEHAIRALTERGGIAADVLVLPHHGGVVRSTGAFINAVNPKITIRSSRQRTSETTNGLPQLLRDRHFFNTADVGAIRVMFDATGITVATHRNGLVLTRSGQPTP